MKVVVRWSRCPSGEAFVISKFATGHDLKNLTATTSDFETPPRLTWSKVYLVQDSARANSGVEHEGVFTEADLLQDSASDLRAGIECVDRRGFKRFPTIFDFVARREKRARSAYLQEKASLVCTGTGRKHPPPKLPQRPALSRELEEKLEM